MIKSDSLLRRTAPSHHPLIGDEAGRKLSKSLGSRSLGDLREEGASPADVRKALGF